MPDGLSSQISVPAPARRKLRHRLSDGLTMLIVSAMALLLLVYLGYGDAQQRYTRYILTGATTQGEVVRGTLENSMRSGVVLGLFVGFNNVARPIIEAENGVAGLEVVDRNGNSLFAADEDDTIKPKAVLAARQRGASDQAGESDIVWDPAYIVVVMPLRDRFEHVGYLLTSVPRATIDQHIREAFAPLVLCALGLSAAFAIIAGLASTIRRSWLAVGYVVIFVAMAGLVTSTMVVLYSEGTAAKTYASAASLAQRLKDIPGFNLNFDQFDDIDDVLAEYRRFDPDISAAALIINEAVRNHTNPDFVGRAWASDPYSFEYAIDISNRAASANRVKVAVAVPRQVVVSEVAGSIRDFAALLVASGFFAVLFFRFAGVMTDRSGLLDAELAEARHAGRALALARPLFFLAVFVEHLNYPFLPQHVLAMIEGAGQVGTLSSAPFAGYYLAFALSLIPGGWLSQRLGAKRLVSWGLCIAGLGLAMLPLADGVVAFTAARVLAGLGQGVLFIGIQSYIIALSGTARRTQGAAIIVFGFQGGMISGTAIGSLLVGYAGPTGVFLLSAAIAAVILVYSIILLPSDRASAPAEPHGHPSIAALLADVVRVIRPDDFLGTMLLIGIPAKAVMTGVILFALPLLLASHGYSGETIGQLIMLYGICVLATSEWIARVVDRTGSIKPVLAWGAIISGIGTMSIGAMGELGSTVRGAGDVFFLIAGIALVGTAHGLINAPIITAIGETRAARRIGVDSATAAYRFLERVGHVLGPVTVGYILTHASHKATSLAWIGAGVVVLGLLFLALPGARRGDVQVVST